MMISKTGTRQFVAPEMLTEACYDSKVDLWGVGCILCYLLYGRIPANSDLNGIDQDDTAT